MLDVITYPYLNLSWTISVKGASGVTTILDIESAIIDYIAWAFPRLVWKVGEGDTSLFRFSNI